MEFYKGVVMKFSFPYRIFVFLCVLYGGSRVQAASNEKDQIEKKPANALRVMTYNIRRDGKEKEDDRKWVKRLPLVTAILEEVEPDIMGLQEAKQNQIDDLVKGNTYAAFGEGRGTSWWGMAEDEHCPLFYNKNKFTLLDSGTFQINTNNPIMSLFGTPGLGLLPRICTFGKFENNQTGQKFYVYNTHLDHKFAGARLSGLRVIKQQIDERSKDGVPVIITGDFNTTLKSSDDADDGIDLKEVLPGYTAAKSMAQKTFGPTATRTGWTDDELKVIDHILISDSADATVAQYGVIQSDKPYPSDHRPVMADIVLGAE